MRSGSQRLERRIQPMAIDDKYEAIESQYPNDPSKLPVKIATFIGKLAIPGAAPFIEAFTIMVDRLSPNLRQERVEQYLKALIYDQKLLETNLAELKILLPDLMEAIQISTWRDAESFNDVKRARYLSIIGNAIRSKQEIKDLTTFIQDVERLGEEDIDALKILHKVMTQASWDTGKPIHPNEFIQRTQELMTQATKEQEMSGHKVDREDFYSQCTRLAGFGLAIEIDSPHRPVPTGDFCFRPSRRGYVLLKLLGATDGKNIPF